MRERLRAMPDKAAASREVVTRLQSLPVYQQAKAVHVYVNLPGEVQTQPLLHDLLKSGRQVFVPYCVEGNQLRLFRLKDAAELTPGAYGILEPEPALREDAARRGAVEQLDLLIVPGVAFDHRGMRLGRGKGYYDRLLAARSETAAVVALAFDCQMAPEIPTDPHDQPMTMVVTQSAVYPSHDAAG